ncbi:L,D-transpeptidase family protein [Nonomuraea thailandensis]
MGHEGPQPVLHRRSRAHHQGQRREPPGGRTRERRGRQDHPGQPGQARRRQLLGHHDRPGEGPRHRHGLRHHRRARRVPHPDQVERAHDLQRHLLPRRPWSTGAQGSSNVSHGCVNASPADAKWFYEFTQRGDIIEVTGTSRKLRFGNGPTPWAKSWEDWLAGSALGKPVNG